MSTELDAFRELRGSGSRRLRNRLVADNMELVDFYVRRFDRRGVDIDDLRQQAFIALIGAVERFDPEMGVSFKTFANRTIEGELKRTLRDQGWSVRPPRSLQELAASVRATEARLTHERKRSPTAAEIAEDLGESRDRVLEALVASGTYRADSLDSDESTTLATRGHLDPGMAAFERADVVRLLMDELDDRDRQVIQMRFFERRTQQEIADHFGFSQSYLSRVLRKALARCRELLDEADELPPD